MILFKLRKTTENEIDTIGIMQGYVGAVYLAGAFAFGSWGWFL